MMEQMQTRELISALADGEVQGNAFARAMELAAREPAALEAWRSYHLIGDVLRSSDLAGGTAPAVFLDRLQARLQHEAPLASPQSAGVANIARSAAMPRQAASNDASFRWKLVAGAASLAAVAAITWSAVGGVAQPEQAQLAALPAGGAVPAAVAPGPMIRDPRLDEFLAAHRQLAGGSALQTPAGFLRNAAFESGSR
jgi:sigma-E factor negative regulatory protein RseA